MLNLWFPKLRPVGHRFFRLLNMSARAHTRRRKVSVARVYAHVNSKHPEEYSDYENMKLEWRYVENKRSFELLSRRNLVNF